MAGAFSGHLLHTFNNASAQPSSSNIITSGAMSFDARTHGTPAPFMSPFLSATPLGFAPLSDDSTTAQQIATLQVKLNKKLGPEYISQRPGPGGGPKLTYAEGWKIINLANEVFGFNGWSSNIVNLATDFIDCNEVSKRYDIGVTAIVRVTLRGGVYHEDVGYGMMENVKSKAAALDKCKKEAITDALKRTLRNFGNLLGNCLYDKAYAQEVVKIKVPSAKFDKNDLYRRPEFEERVPDVPAPQGEAITPGPSRSTREESHVKVENEGQAPETPITYIPRHLRPEMASAARAQGSTSSPTTPSHGAATPSNAHASTSGLGSSATVTVPVQAKSIGLPTPHQTPTHPPRPPPARMLPPRTVTTSPLAQMRSAPERNVSAPKPSPPLPARANSAGNDNGNHTGNTSVTSADDDDDSFPISTQDGALFATVDLGRPIDYDEGTGGVSVMDDDGDVSMSTPESNAAQVQSRLQLQPQPAATVSLSASSNSSHASATSMSNKPGTSARQPSPPALNRTPRTPSMGGIHYPADPKPAAHEQQRPKYVPKAVPLNTLKRSADVMQADSTAASSTRPPVQGMGLAWGRYQQQNAHVRGSPDNGEVNDVKRFKH